MLKAKKIIINGVVQGVGFRPFVYKLAKRMNIKGVVFNSGDGVVIELKEEEKKVNDFIEKIKLERPLNSEITSIEIMEADDREFNDFKIVESKANEIKTTIPSDLGICRDCVEDIFDPENRRYLYPFTNCTNCGPRFSIVEKLPYDRKYTTMKKFKMCHLCSEEYENPMDRRFHAQPNACSKCGPYVWVRSSDGRIIKKLAIDYIVSKIYDGNVVLIKGLGGFHISCDGFNRKAVMKIREIKRRDFKPLALMVDDIKDLIDYVEIRKKEEEILNSSKAPILMLKKKKFEPFEYISPGLETVGVMIAYTPLHKIIFRKLKEKGFKNPLVMTSCNFKDEPLIKENSKAIELFGNFDILMHNREIKNRIDDSVGFVDEHNNFRIIRRARGFVPESIKVQIDCKENIFAAGGDIKNVFGFYRKKEIILSQHIGDLEIKENRDFFIESYNNIKKLFNLDFDIACVDAHPSYYSSLITMDFNIKKYVKVYHHISHIYSVMAENNIVDNVIGVAFDGTGYGSDGNIWGGEFFLVKNKKIKRIAHFEYIPLCGGDVVTREIWRSFVAFFRKERDFVEEVLSHKIEREKIDFIYNMMDKKINSPLSSSCGRVFDAVSVLVTADTISGFEAQGAMKLEKCAFDYKDLKESYKFELKKEGDCYVVGLDPLRMEMIKDYRSKRKEIISVKFHRSIINLIMELVIKFSRDYDVSDICISGGVFQNRFLVDYLIESFSKTKYKIYLNSRVPSNDGGIALGQIYYVLTGSEFLG